MTSGHNHESDEPCIGCAPEWLRAESLADLGGCGARWLEGELRWQPAYGAATPDPETAALVPVLAALNRAGWWTECSQPGEREGSWQQRAYVSGWCTEQTADSIRAGLLDTELVVLATPAALETWVQIPISRDGRSEWTWAGGHPGADELIETYGHAIGQGALLEVAGGWYVEVIDMAWGRDDLLWPAVLDALENPRQREVTVHG